MPRWPMQQCEEQWRRSPPVTMSSGILKTHRRNGSGELDVFEAAFYFSGEANEVGALGLGRAWRAERRSLDTPKEATLLQRPQELNESRSKDRPKQPSSPGVGKLATFLSSFFSNLTASRRKSSKSVNPAQPCRNVENMERQQRRRRRNSIDHVDCTRSREKMKCGVGVLPWEQEHKKSVTLCLQREAWHGNRVTDEVLIAQRGGKTSSRRSSRRREEDGNESDSSSDLFELKSYAI